MAVLDKYGKDIVYDGLSNVASGLAGSGDKSTYNRWDYSILNDWITLQTAYTESWAAARIIDLPAGEAVAKWRTIKSAKAEEIHRHENEIEYKHTIAEALLWSRLFGGCGILMATGQDLEKPFNINLVKKGDLNKSNCGLIVFDRYDLNGINFNYLNPLKKNYLQPTYYYIRGGNIRVHHSHIIRFYGRKMPKRIAQTYQGWGDSVLRKCLKDVEDLIASKRGITNLMYEANVDVFRAEDLWKRLSTKQDDKIINRYTNLNIMKSSMQAIVLDKTEEYDRKTLSLGGVSETLEQFMIMLSAASGIPMTKLFGTSAKGLNATGEGDMNQYYDMLQDIQNNKVAPPLKLLDQVLCRSAIGYYPDDFDYSWNPLQQQDQLKKAQVDKIKSDTHIAYMDAGLINPAQAQREMQADEVYQFKDEDIEAVENHYSDPLNLLAKENISELEQAEYESRLNINQGNDFEINSKE